LQLLTLTFVRTNELIGALWTEFDLDNALWIVPAERMKMRSEHVVPLTSRALEIIAELKTIAGNSRYLLPGRNPNKPISNNTLLFALYRLGYKGKMTGQPRTQGRVSHAGRTQVQATSCATRGK